MQLTPEYARKRREMIGGHPKLRVFLKIDENKEVEGKARLQFEALEDGRIFVDCLAEITALESPKKTEVCEGGFWLEVSKGPQSVEISYRLQASQDGMGLHVCHPVEEGRPLFYTNFVPQMARRVFPLWDQPDIRTVFELGLDVPDWMTVVSNYPVLSEKIENSRKLVWFEPTMPLASYLFHFTAGDLIRRDYSAASIPISFYARPAKADVLRSEELGSLLEDCLKWYEKTFEVPFPFPKYDQIFVPQFYWGGMENAGAVVLREEVLFEHVPEPQEAMNRDNLLAHELSHMWFGDFITMKWWDDLWLNEAFATWVTSAALKGTGRWPDAMTWLRSDVAARALEEDALDSTHPVLTPVPIAEEAFQNFDAITYQKGAALLSTLADGLGEDFLRGVRTYFQRFGGKNATRDDFFSCLPELQLVSEIRMALESTGSPRLMYKDKQAVFSGGGGLLELHFQNRGGDRFSLKDQGIVQGVPLGVGQCLWFRPLLESSAIPDQVGGPAESLEWMLAGWEGLFVGSLSVSGFLDLTEKLLRDISEPVFSDLVSRLASLKQRGFLSEKKAEELLECLLPRTSGGLRVLQACIRLAPESRAQELIRLFYEDAPRSIRKSLLLLAAGSGFSEELLRRDFPEEVSEENGVLHRQVRFRSLDDASMALELEGLVEEPIATTLKGALLSHVFEGSQCREQTAQVWERMVDEGRVFRDEALLMYWMGYAAPLRDSRRLEASCERWLKSEHKPLLRLALRLNSRLKRWKGVA